ncbi:hypothetical protein AHAS_Ahas15G0166400 [Arachis hypogaea]
MNINQMAFLTCSSSSSFSTKLPLHFSTPLKRTRRRSNHDFLRMVTRSCLDDSSALLRAAQYTVDTYVKSGMAVRLGFGHASCMAIQHLGRQLRTGNLKDIVGIPIASEAAKSGIPLDTYQDSTQIDFTFDDADAIEEGTLVTIIGRRRHKQCRLPHDPPAVSIAPEVVVVPPSNVNRKLVVWGSGHESYANCTIHTRSIWFAWLVKCDQDE